VDRIQGWIYLYHLNAESQSRYSKPVGTESIEHYDDWCAQAFERVILRVATLSRPVMVLRVAHRVCYFESFDAVSPVA